MRRAPLENGDERMREGVWGGVRKDSRGTLRELICRNELRNGGIS
jgi:hypothetical protein